MVNGASTSARLVTQGRWAQSRPLLGTEGCVTIARLPSKLARQERFLVVSADLFSSPYVLTMSGTRRKRFQGPMSSASSQIGRSVRSRYDTSSRSPWRRATPASAVVHGSPTTITAKNAARFAHPITLRSSLCNVCKSAAERWPMTRMTSPCSMVLKTGLSTDALMSPSPRQSSTMAST